MHCWHWTWGRNPVSVSCLCLYFEKIWILYGCSILSRLSEFQKCACKNVDCQEIFAVPILLGSPCWWFLHSRHPTVLWSYSNQDWVLTQGLSGFVCWIMFYLDYSSVLLRQFYLYAGGRKVREETARFLSVLLKKWLSNYYLSILCRFMQNFSKNSLQSISALVKSRGFCNWFQ